MNPPNESTEPARDESESRKGHHSVRVMAIDWIGLACSLLGCFLWLFQILLIPRAKLGREGALLALELQLMFSEAGMVVLGIPATILALVALRRSTFPIKNGNRVAPVLIKTVSIVALAVGGYIMFTVLYREISLRGFGFR